MLERRKAIIAALFAALSIASASTLVYSAHSYIGVYRATQTLTMTIEDFDIKILNATYAYTSTLLTFNNPSEYEFDSLIIEQRLYLTQARGPEFFAFSRASDPTPYYPMRLLPQSRTNTTLTLDVPQQKMPVLQSTPQCNWLITVTVVCEGPIVERFTLDDSAAFTTPGS